jgi:hypothetical protein
MSGYLKIHSGKINKRFPFSRPISTFLRAAMHRPRNFHPTNICSNKKGLLNFEFRLTAASTFVLSQLKLRLADTGESLDSLGIAVVLSSIILSKISVGLGCSRNNQIFFRFEPKQTELRYGE